MGMRVVLEVVVKTENAGLRELREMGKLNGMHGGSLLKVMESMGR